MHGGNPLYFLKIIVFNGIDLLILMLETNYLIIVLQCPLENIFPHLSIFFRSTTASIKLYNLIQDISPCLVCLMLQFELYFFLVYTLLH